MNPGENAYDDYDSVKVGESDYDVKLPTFDEGGSPVSADGGIVGITRHSLCLDPSCGVAGSHAHNEGSIILLSDPCPVEGCTTQGEHTHHSESHHGSTHH